MLTKKKERKTSQTIFKSTQVRVLLPLKSEDHSALQKLTSRKSRLFSRQIHLLNWMSKVAILMLGVSNSRILESFLGLSSPSSSVSKVLTKIRKSKSIKSSLKMCLILKSHLKHQWRPINIWKFGVSFRKFLKSPLSTLVLRSDIHWLSKKKKATIMLSILASKNLLFPLAILKTTLKSTVKCLILLNRWRIS